MYHDAFPNLMSTFSWMVVHHDGILTAAINHNGLMRLHQFFRCLRSIINGTSKLLNAIGNLRGASKENVGDEGME